VERVEAKVFANSERYKKVFSNGTSPKSVAPDINAFQKSCIHTPYLSYICWAHCSYQDPVACFLPSLFFTYNFVFCVEKRIRKTKLMLVLYKYANKKAEHAVLLRNAQTRRQKSIVRLGNLKTNKLAKNFS
jgi:hypothetical protein